jgi:ABC-type polysaccharide/polyol phosphate transport system ATPase subunit
MLDGKRDFVIEIQNLSKKYRIGFENSYLTLRDKLLNDKTYSFFNFFKKNIQNNFFALSKINLNIKKGESLGIIGINGSGKSTLLKIISGITYPSQGQINIKGKVSSMLELGAGFHSELTGRENIFFNGAVLGMKKFEINKIIKDIIKFSEIGDFIDIPVKRYSSGMHLRLAFSVSIYLAADIIIIDEVLAVGDLGFQKKCLEKIRSIKENSEKTIILVSHSLDAVEGVCDKTLYLKNGKIEDYGETSYVVKKYLEKSFLKKNKNTKAVEGNGKVRIDDVKIYNDLGDLVIRSGDKINLKINLSNNLKEFNKCRVVIGIYNDYSSLLIRIDTGDIDIAEFKKSEILIRTKSVMLHSTSCYVNVAVFIDGKLSERVVGIKHFNIFSGVSSLKDRPLLNVSSVYEY